MKQYSIFYVENYIKYPIFQRGNDYWLGGNGMDNLLFTNRFMAEKESRGIRDKNYKYFRNGKIKVYKAVIQALE